MKREGIMTMEESLTANVFEYCTRSQNIAPLAVNNRNYR